MSDYSSHTCSVSELMEEEETEAKANDGLRRKAPSEEVGENGKSGEMNCFGATAPQIWDLH